MTLIWFILGLSVLIFIHELGHFTFAKLFGVYVYEFSLFMGPKLLQRKGKETKYTLRLLPIGGYCSMAGEQDQQSQRNDEEVDKDKINVPFERTINGVSWWKKFVILAAGATFNIILCFFLLVIVFAGSGVANSNPNIRVVEDSILEQAGLQTGDLVTSITGRLSDGTEYTLNNITDFSQISEVIDKTNPKPDEINAVGMTQCLDFEILRNNEVISYNNVCRTFTTFEVSSSNDELVISKMEPIFGLGQTTRDATFNEVITSAWNTEKQMATLIFDALGTLFTKDGLSNVSGPVGMYESAVSFAKDGFLSFLLFLAMISVNLGIINLLPLPALDGGRLLVMIVEKIARRKLNPKVETIINAVGFIFLIGFIILITIKDIFF